MRNRRRILGALMAGMALAAPAAASAAPPVPAVRPMYFEHLTTRDGLSQSTVNGILQDSQGYHVARDGKRPRPLRRRFDSRVSP